MRIPKIIKGSTIDGLFEVNRILHPILNVPVHLTPFYKLSDLLLLVMVDFFHSENLVENSVPDVFEVA